jgi:hypothetical protein
MKLEFGLTPELTNTQVAPVVAVAAYFEAENVLAPLQSITSAAIKGDFSLANKLTQLILSLLTGCEYIALVNTRLRCERIFAQLYRIETFADQSTLSRGLNGLTQMNLDQLEVAVRQISHQCSQTRHHDWRGFLQLDFDLSGLPCGKQAEGSTKGYFEGKKTSQAAN